MRTVGTILAIVLAAFLNAANHYHTPQLEKIASTIGLNLPDAISANTTIDSVIIFKEKDIHVRTNGLGDIVHIGYNLFAPALKEHYANSPVFDFLERYLLEMDLNLDDKTPEVKMDLDQVTTVKGNIRMLYQLTPNSDVKFELDVISRKMYRVSCEFGNKNVRIVFPVNNELLTGANMMELEEIFKRDVQRMLTISGDALIIDWSDTKVSRAKDALIVDGGTYLSKMIRGSLYLTETNGVRKLYCDRKNAARSVSNILLTGLFERDIPLKMDIDRYSGKTDSVEVTLQQFIAYCKAERCKLYFGVKTILQDVLTGTLFAYNEGYSYDHMLSLSFPLSILDGSNVYMTGKVYTYIPLHFVPEKYFNIEHEQ